VYRRAVYCCAMACITALLFGGLPARAQLAAPRCPVFVSPADAALCQTSLGQTALANVDLPPAEETPEVVPVAYDADSGLRLLSRRPLFGAQDISLLTRRDGDAQAYANVSEPKLRVMREEQAALQPRTVNSSYETPIFDGLAINNSSAVSQGESDPGADNAAKSVNSKFGLAYEEYGLTFRVNPDAAANWGNLAGSGNRRFGVDNSVSAMIARDLTLTLSTGYKSELYPGNPVADTSSERHRVAIAQHFQSGYKIGVSAQRQNDYSRSEERDMNILGLQVGVPLGQSLNATASHDFGLGEKRDLNAAGALPFYGRQQSTDLQLQWTPAFLASKAMTLMAGYKVTQDELADSSDPYLTQARLNLAMRF